MLFSVVKSQLALCSQPWFRSETKATRQQHLLTARRTFHLLAMEDIFARNPGIILEVKDICIKKRSSCIASYAVSTATYFQY